MGMITTLTVVTTKSGSFWHLAERGSSSTLCGREVARVRFDEYKNVDCRNCDHKATGAQRTR